MIFLHVSVPKIVNLVKKIQVSAFEKHVIPISYSSTFKKRCFVSNMQRNEFQFINKLTEFNIDVNYPTNKPGNRNVLGILKGVRKCQSIGACNPQILDSNPVKVIGGDEEESPASKASHCLQWYPPASKNSITLWFHTRA